MLQYFRISAWAPVSLALQYELSDSGFKDGENTRITELYMVDGELRKCTLDKTGEDSRRSPAVQLNIWAVLHEET